MHVLALEVHLRIAHAQSLKDKRQVVRPLVEGPPRRFGVAAAEVDEADTHQRAVLGYATVSASPRHAEEVIDAVEDFVWSHPEVEVLSTARTWLEDAEA